MGIILATIPNCSEYPSFLMLNLSIVSLELYKSDIQSQEIARMSENLRMYTKLAKLSEITCCCLPINHSKSE